MALQKKAQAVAKSAQSSTATDAPEEDGPGLQKKKEPRGGRGSVRITKSSGGTGSSGNAQPLHWPTITVADHAFTGLSGRSRVLRIFQPPKKIQPPNVLRANVWAGEVGLRSSRFYPLGRGRGRGLDRASGPRAPQRRPMIASPSSTRPTSSPRDVHRISGRF
jgi:hypothetical protein